MEQIFEDAFDFLLTSTRTYVTAMHIRDKFLAIQLILVSEVMSVDALLDKFNVDKITLNAETVNKLSMARILTYKERIKELKSLEKRKKELFSDIQPALSSRLEETVEYVRRLYESDFRVLLDINYKVLLNDAQGFVFSVKNILHPKTV